MITAMFAAIAIAQTPAPPPSPSRLELLIDAAYITGRCAAWLTTDARDRTERTFATRAPLKQAYDEGVEDAKAEPLRSATCEKLLLDVRRELGL